ncbi:MAG: metalloregulator ArsR/SmtB family transcription factor [Candidatus Methanomethylophilaceae archaeon]|jgi:ArsR family transcriptional regulator|nr:metalloregulator ArsR/SmtB family transcription factor [Candidatus Methanomethylophilaceae archaeon]MDD2779552.1 metalloregulator ArsR/SmtB family transcription factor [Candidatus Methanomethylophilaceae archaeon]MDD3128564.1 metalloregulator ArsR/SmtB family transcription factor [Candidatus Methanomethylophilaceae archaeon]MDD4119825.1 metalloregulator ArsR/SmtB family transcription factor [Candidatus Methanomethylophilaceae archaeon]MDD4454998.1 metalloregulator ArsR/SmtB family transcript
MLSEDQTDIFKALSDRNRLRIVSMLAEGEMCACKLLENLSVSQPTLSHHMGVLIRSGLVEGRKDGQWMHYSLNKSRIDILVSDLKEVSDMISRNQRINDEDGC